MARVVARLTAANVIGAATGFITGPLLARALGPAGRGDLAAVIVPFTLAAPIVGLGIPAYAYRTLPQGADRGEVIASLGLPLLILGGLACAAAVPLADLLGSGRPVVRTWLIVGFCTMPLVVAGNLLILCLGALERWRRVLVTRLTPFLVVFLAIVTLSVVGRLTVAGAAAATIAGTLLAAVPGFALLRGVRLRFRRATSCAAVAFGLRAWVGGLAQMGNGRLDQLLMITLVPARELGLYAVAVTISGASGLAANALSPPLMARVAGGERALIAEGVRAMVAATVAVDLALGAISPLLLMILFGPAFSGAYPMVLVLLLAQVSLSGATVLSSALQADGAPTVATAGELIALVITVGGLLLVLRPLGGVGAALVSLAAYSASFGFQVTVAARRVGVPARSFLVPGPADLRRLRAGAGSLLGHVVPIRLLGRREAAA